MTFAAAAFDRARPGWGFLAMDDGVEIAARLVPAKGEARAAAVLLHGAGLHSGPYVPFARLLAARGVAVAALDQRGHGASGGEPGHIRTLDRYVRDLAACLTRLSAAAERPVVVLAHSGGAATALRAMARAPETAVGAFAALTPTFADDPMLLRRASGGRSVGRDLRYMLQARPAAAREDEPAPMRFAFGRFLLARLTGFGRNRTVLTYRPNNPAEEPYAYSAWGVAGAMLGAVETGFASLRRPMFLLTGGRDPYVDGEALQTVLPWAVPAATPFDAVHVARGDHFNTLLLGARDLGDWIDALPGTAPAVRPAPARAAAEAAA